MRRITRSITESPPAAELGVVLTSLRALATPNTLAGMARYAIPSDKALGVAVKDLQRLGKELGASHSLAAALWETDIYEARMLASFVDEPAEVTPEQMDRWIAELDNWAICDTLCFHLFDRTPHAFGRVEAWSDRPEELVKRGAFALLACLALHGRVLPDEAFRSCFPLIARAAKSSPAVEVGWPR